MPNRKSASALRQLRDVFAEGTATGLSDNQLLERFARKRAQSVEAARAAETAFEVLVNRHGAMVWGVCRRVLGDVHEAEDAFQATFLLLVRKAGSLHIDGSLGRWLYGVARRIAIRARSQARKSASDGHGVFAAGADDPSGELEQRELRAIVNDEVDRLPLKYRCAIELCYFQGMTHDQAAHQLNWPVATVKSRLARGRHSLRRRLARRGLAPVGAGVTAALRQESCAAVPPAVVQSIVHASVSRAGNLLSPAVVGLTKGALQMMMWEKLRLASVGIAVVVGVTAAALAQRAPETPPAKVQQATAAAPISTPLSGQDAPDPRWSKTISNGATVEVLAGSTHPSSVNTWWRPDGTPLPQPPCDPPPANIKADGEIVLRALVVRTTKLPPATEWKWSVKEANGETQTQPKRGGESLSGLSATVAVFPSTLKSCTIRFQIAAGVWTTILTRDTSEGAAASANAIYFFGPPIATKSGSTLTVTHNLRDVFVRLVATDLDGEEWPSEPRGTATIKNLVQTTFKFSLPPDEITGIRLQTQPFEVVELSGVALCASATSSDESPKRPESRLGDLMGGDRVDECGQCDRQRGADKRSRISGRRNGSYR